MVKEHDFLLCMCTSEDFAQTQLNFAPSDDSETVAFRNCAVIILTVLIVSKVYFRFSKILNFYIFYIYNLYICNYPLF